MWANGVFGLVTKRTKPQKLKSCFVNKAEEGKKFSYLFKTKLHSFDVIIITLLTFYFLNEKSLAFTFT